MFPRHTEKKRHIGKEEERYWLGENKGSAVHIYSAAWLVFLFTVFIHSSKQTFRHSLAVVCAVSAHSKVSMETTDFPANRERESKIWTEFRQSPYTIMCWMCAWLKKKPANLITEKCFTKTTLFSPQHDENRLVLSWSSGRWMFY